MITIPTEALYVGVFVVVMVIAALVLYGVAVTLEAMDAHRDADEQRAKVRRQCRRGYRGRGRGPYEQERSADTRGPIGGVRHA